MTKLRFQPIKLKKKIIIKKKKKKSDKPTKPCDLNSEITNRMQTGKDYEIQF
jgi:hypothetical protein